MLSGGVALIFSPEKTYDIAYSLGKVCRAIQNRGETAVGIALGKDAILNSAIDRYTRLGKVRELLDGKNIRKHINFGTPYVSIGHVHKGKVGENYIEPIEVGGNGYRCAIGIDGKVLDVHNFKQKFEAHSDAELIGKLIGHHYEKCNDVGIAVKKTMEDLYDCAAFSATMLWSDKKETRGIVFQDPRGLKPLCYGKKDEMYIFSSQSTSLELMEAKFEDFTVPGGMYMFSKNSTEPEFQQLLPREDALCMFEYPYYHKSAGLLPGSHGPQYVLDVRNRFGKTLAIIDRETGKLKTEDAICTPIPASGWGGGQGYSRESGIILTETLIKVPDALRTFDMGLDKEAERDEEIKSKFYVVHSKTRGKVVHSIDDSQVYGATSRVIITYHFRHMGQVAELHWKNTCAPKIAPCITGFNDERILVAEPYANEDMEVICQKVAEAVNADTVTYPTVENNMEDIGVDRNKLCSGCITGEYCIPAAQKIWEKLKTSRKRRYPKN